MSTISPKPTPAVEQGPPSPATTTTLQRLILLGVSTLLSWLAAEWIWASFLRPSQPPRVLFFSENPWDFDDRGFSRFKPNATIRTAAVYGDTIEYDVTFSTNSQGFIDSQEYSQADILASSGRTFAVVGDSFTAGIHAGKPWVPRLRAEAGFDLGADRLFNFGISGTGLRNFDLLLAAFENELANAKILLVAITSDFDRPLWQPLTVDDRIILCDSRKSEDRCREQGTGIFEFPPMVTPQEILELARGKYRQASQGPWEDFLRQSMLAFAIRKLRNKAATPRDHETGALQSISSRFPDADIKLLHIPQKEEVLAGSFEDRRETVESAGIEYISGWEICGMSAQDYFPIDSHPNASGYEKIRECASLLLGLRTAAT